MGSGEGVHIKNITLAKTKNLKDKNRKLNTLLYEP